MVLENGLAKENASFRTAGNVVLLTIQNFTPPVFPFANAWNREVKRVLPAGLQHKLQETIYTPEAAGMQMEELQVEESCGQGLGVSLLLLASVTVVAFRSRFTLSSWRLKSTEALWQTGVRLAPWVSLAALLSQSLVYPIGRICAPFYPLLVPLLLMGAAHERLFRQCWWRMLALAVFAMAAGLLIISPARPLFPAQTLLGKAGTSSHPWLARAQVVYSIYHDRWDAFAPVRAILPADATVMGMVTFDDPETSLWRPFGSRRIEHVWPGETLSELRQQNIRYLFVKSDVFELEFGSPFVEWLKRMDGRILRTIPLSLRASKGPTDWYLAELP
jgi:hypothetical protein